MTCDLGVPEELRALNIVDSVAAAISVGEPTGASPNHYGDASPIFLRRSGLVVSASSLFWQNTRPFPMEERRWTPPQLSVSPTIEAYRQGRDLALEAILAWTPRPPLHETMLAAFHAKGEAGSLAALARFASAPENRFAFLLEDLLRVARTLRQQGHTGAAVAVARRAVDRYPELPSAHEGLGDALAAAGDLEGAERSYRRIMELVPRGLPRARARLRLGDLDRP